MKLAEQKIFCICVDEYKYYEGVDYDELFEVLSTLKNKKSKINKILIEKCEYMIEKLSFEQDYWSRTARGFYKNWPRQY